MLNRPRTEPLWAALGWVLWVALGAGCASIGPGTVPRDRFDYSGSISESWKRQTLLNIVKLRYLDPPIWVDVGQIVAGYSLETSLSAAGNFSDNSAIGAAGTVGGAARFTDRPTITYTPLTGNKFIRALMSPLPPESVLFTIQSGWPADAVFSAAAGGVNGLKNQASSISGVSPPDPGFLRMLELMRKIQLSGAVGFRIKRDAQSNETAVVTFRTQDISAETQAEIKELRQLLRLDPDESEFELVFGAMAQNNREFALMTRSLMHIMGIMAAHVSVPNEHIEQQRATPGFDSEQDKLSLVRIQSAKSRPKDAYAAVPYRDHWFFIDDRDLRTKRAFAFIMMLFTLAETGENENLPLITIPAQ